MTDGVVVVDKPAGLTSHDVVAAVRRLAGTRRVGHAGTLDPMATGVLVLGVGRATRLLGHLSGATKSYAATVRLGISTVTDDAEGDVVARTDASAVTEPAIVAEARALTGPLSQVPSSVSAVKVQGRPAYARVRAGDAVVLAPREITVSRFDVRAVRHGEVDGSAVVDVDVEVDCSSGTYVRALARDLGAALGVGGHLVALRRTRVGPFELAEASRLDELAEGFAMLDLGAAAQRAFPRVDLDADAARRVRHGVAIGRTGRGAGPVAAFGPDGTFLALLADAGPLAKSLAVFVG